MMQDEQHRSLDKAVAHDSSFVADDAVSNRSDDTALEESDALRRGPADAEHEERPGDESNQFEQYPLPQTDERGDEVAQEHAIDESSTQDVDADDEPEETAEDEEVSEGESAGAELDAAAAERAAARKRPIYEEIPHEEIRMDWYILKVQSNRERSIAEALERKIRIEGLDRYFDQVIVPTEKVTEFKGGKKKVVERKLYPGYIVVHMHVNDETWFAVRETSGVGDFTGSGGKPTPMLPHEVARIIQTEEEETSESPKLDIKFSSGDKVKVKEGNFENFEGEVNTIDEASGRVTVMINIFGRSTPVELEYWQIEAV
jgi:transcription termination/antitermination protein NusG